MNPDVTNPGVMAIDESGVRVFRETPLVLSPTPYSPNSSTSPPKFSTIAVVFATIILA